MTPTREAVTDVADRPPTLGLTQREALVRLQRDGRNVLPSPERPSVWRELAGQLFHFFAIMLWVAGAMAIAAGMTQLGVAIFVVVVINGVFSFVQQRHADQAAERLRDLLPRRATVVRDGAAIEIDSAELVVGDVVLLSGGDRISADLEIITSTYLVVDTSMVTGESAGVAAATGDEVLAGSFVMEGEATAIVMTTGSATRLAGIARLSSGGPSQQTPLASQLHRVVSIVSVTSVLVGASFFAVAMLLGERARDGFLFAIGVTVALVPEGLLPTVTLTLAVGAQRMAQRHALVRHLEAVETLGSTTFVCVDKTGTLTQNRMAVTSVWTPSGSIRVEGDGYGPTASVVGSSDACAAAAQLAQAAVRCSNGRTAKVGDDWIAQGDPMEAAIVALAQRLGVAIDPAPVPSSAVDESERHFGFDPRRRMMSTATADTVYVKGAPESVLPRCTRSSGEREAASAAVDEMTANWLRVIAVATRPRPADSSISALNGSGPEVDERDAFESDLRLLGLVGLQDPPRAHVRPSIERCRQAGIAVGMITGDHPATAMSIADAVGLRRSGAPAVEGRNLPDDAVALGELVDHDGLVVSRASPEDKLRIAQALADRGHVVAMTGDGVNDGPALHASAVGVAMGLSGTDVARESADLVLLDDDFATIVAAVEHGRGAFANIRRFITYHLTDNVAELTPFVVWALSGGRFPLAIGVLQVLCLDIGTDLLPALALGAEQPAADVLAKSPHQGDLLDRKVLVRAFGVLGPTEAFVEMAAFLTSLVAAGWRPGRSFPTGHDLHAASGAAFAAVVFGQVANAFACRSETHWAFSRRLSPNRLLFNAVALELVALAGFLFVGPVADLLNQRPPPLAGWIVAASAIPAVLSVDAAFKRATVWRANRSRNRHGA